MDIDKWADRVYAEEDFGKNISITCSGLVGLCVYLYSNDWKLSGFLTIIAFPLFRIIASVVYARHEIQKEKERAFLASEESLNAVKNYTAKERLVLKAFVDAGGATVTFSQIELNQTHLPEPGVNSLVQRGVLHKVLTADGMSKGLSINIEIFEAARRYYNSE